MNKETYDSEKAKNKEALLNAMQEVHINGKVNKEFVPYPLALRMKALGFDEPCLAWFVSEEHGLELGAVVKSDLIKEGLLAPTFSQAFRFFRDNYGMFHNVDKIFSDEFGYIITNEKDEPLNDFDFNSWEEAELACLDKLIEIVESKSE